MTQRQTTLKERRRPMCVRNVIESFIAHVGYVVRFLSWSCRYDFSFLF